MCRGCEEKSKLGSSVTDALNSLGSIDDIFPVNAQTGQRAMNINVQFDYQSIAILLGVILLAGYILKKV